MNLHPFFSHPAANPLIMSHDGDASGGGKPGSTESYQEAWRKGFRCFQIDVVALANGELVSSHAITGRKRSWESKSVAELRSDGKVMSTVDEILDAVPDSIWNLEVKSAFATDAVAELLLRRSEAPSRFLISSPFRPRILSDLRDRVGPDLALAASLIDGGLLGFGLRPTPFKTDAVQLWKPLVRSQRILDRCESNGTHVQVWTVNAAAAMQGYLDQGIPGIITDDHDVAGKVMRARGHWPEIGEDGDHAGV